MSKVEDLKSQMAYGGMFLPDQDPACSIAEFNYIRYLSEYLTRGLAVPTRQIEIANRTISSGTYRATVVEKPPAYNRNTCLVVKCQEMTALEGMITSEQDENGQRKAVRPFFGKAGYRPVEKLTADLRALGTEYPDKVYHSIDTLVVLLHCAQVAIGNEFIENIDTMTEELIHNQWPNVQLGWRYLYDPSFLTEVMQTPKFATV